MWNWVQTGVDRWTFDVYNEDGAVVGTKLLLHVGDVLVEKHRTTVHVYAAGLAPSAEWPLSDAVWLRTEPRPELTGLTDDDAWPILADIAAEPPPAE